MSYERAPLTKAIVFSFIFIATLSKCGEGISGGAPVNKVVFIENSKEGSLGNVKSANSSLTNSQITKAKEILKSINKTNFQRINAKKIFVENCKNCHGHTGQLGSNGAKDLSKSTISLEESVAQIYHGRGLMIPYKDVLSNEELVAVAKYTETLRK